MEKIKSGSIKLKRSKKYAMHRSRKVAGGSTLRGDKLIKPFRVTQA